MWPCCLQQCVHLFRFHIHGANVISLCPGSGRAGRAGTLRWLPSMDGTRPAAIMSQHFGSLHPCEHLRLHRLPETAHARCPMSANVCWYSILNILRVQILARRLHSKPQPLQDQPQNTWRSGVLRTGMNRVFQL